VLSVSAVVVNHDGGEQIIRCLSHLQAQQPPLEEVIVVDSGSTDGSCDAVRRAYSAARVLELGTNLGPAAARNRGLLETRTPFVLFVDDDVYLAPDCTRLLLQRLLAADAAVAVPRLLLFPDVDLIQLDGADAHFVGTMILRNTRRPAASVPSRACPIGAFSTSCVLADGPAMLDAGGLDETFFIYFEDLELGLRLRSLGHQLVVEPAAIAWHDRGAGTPDLSYRDQGSYPRRRALLTMRNRLQVIWLHYRLRTILVLAPVLALYELATLVYAIRRGWFGSWLEGWGWLLKHSSDLARRRRAIQVRRRLDDGELLIAGPLPLAAGVLRSSIEHRVVGALAAILDGYWRVVRRQLGWRPTEPGPGAAGGACPSEPVAHDSGQSDRPLRPSSPDGGKES
jgi:GT2 family glycosyltransferase